LFFKTYGMTPKEFRRVNVGRLQGGRDGPLRAFCCTLDRSHAELTWEERADALHEGISDGHGRDQGAVAVRNGADGDLDCLRDLARGRFDDELDLSRADGVQQVGRSRVRRGVPARWLFLGLHGTFTAAQEDHE
jgi:hypothetical protein